LDRPAEAEGFELDMPPIEQSDTPERPPGQRGGMPFEDGGGLVHADEPFIGQAFDNGVKRRMW
jgi:hypothetical protein